MHDTLRPPRSELSFTIAHSINDRTLSADSPAVTAAERAAKVARRRAGQSSGHVRLRCSGGTPPVSSTADGASAVGDGAAGRSASPTACDYRTPPQKGGHTPTDTGQRTPDRGQPTADSGQTDVPLHCSQQESGRMRWPSSSRWHVFVMSHRSWSQITRPSCGREGVGQRGQRSHMTRGIGSVSSQHTASAHG